MVINRRFSQVMIRTINRLQVILVLRK